MIEVLITDRELNSQHCIDFVKNDAAGGISCFVGTVRNQTKGRNVLRLEFESFVPMAEKEMHKIAKHIEQKWKATHICIHHRIGTLEIGEVPVVIAISAAHRKAAFEACQNAIDTLKETVPIWKKEFFEDGEVWVAAHP